MSARVCVAAGVLVSEVFVVSCWVMASDRATGMLGDLCGRRNANCSRLRLALSAWVDGAVWSF